MMLVQYNGIENVYIFLFIIALSIIVLFLANFTFENTIYYVTKSVLALPLILLLSGYSLIYILFGEKLKTPEFIILSVGMSVCITILDAMIVHFLGMQINVSNILSSISITTIILALIALLKTIIVPKRRIPEEF